uniref:ionotropic receptor 117 precursor n=1 Tax=Aedes aegypti TaxID=7159 RepID=UPI000C2F815F|nr:ionotropic receptor 117 precursor [Aedes aegypti]
MIASHIFRWLFPVALGLLDTEVAQILLHSKPLICESDYAEYVYYHANLSQPLSSILNQYLWRSSTSVTVFSEVSYYQEIVRPYESCSLLFVEHFPIANASGFRAINRKRVVTSSAAYDHVHEVFIKHNIYDAVFFVVGQSQLVIRHYNRYRKQYSQWTTLKHNPFIEATRDLAGSLMAVKGYTSSDLMFIDFLVANMNATIGEVRGYKIGFAILYRIFDYGSMYHQMYMHQTKGIQALVPVLHEPKPMISILVDPFDVETWIVIGVTILATASLRLFYSRRYNVWEYLTSVREIVANSIESSPLLFYRQLERFNIGVLNLLNVVVMTAYNSLVISFLLNTRYFPELDTFDQVNKTCCWESSHAANVLKFHVSNNCLSSSNESYNSPRSHKDRYLCYFIDTIAELTVGEFMAVNSYRRSELVIQTEPVMAISNEDVGLIEWIRVYANVFYAENALYKSMEPFEGFATHPSNQDKPIAVGDLTLMWLAYFCGLSLSLVALIGELVFYYFKQQMLGRIYVE